MNGLTELASLGHLCGVLHRSYGELHAAVEAAGIRPQMTLDGVPRYDVQAVRRALGVVGGVEHRSAGPKRERR